MRSIPALDAFQLHLTPLNSTPPSPCMERPRPSARRSDGSLRGCSKTSRATATATTARTRTRTRAAAGRRRRRYRSTTRAATATTDRRGGSARELASLDASRNQIDSLPDRIASLTALEKLDVSHNVLTSLPGLALERLPLRSLDASGNKIAELPLALPCETLARRRASWSSLFFRGVFFQTQLSPPLRKSHLHRASLLCDRRRNFASGVIKSSRRCRTTSARASGSRSSARRIAPSGAFSLHWSPYDRVGVVNAVP